MSPKPVDIRVSTPAVDRRSAVNDRRSAVRPGTPGRRASDVARAGLLALACSVFASGTASAEGPVKFGFNAESVEKARDLRLPITYSTIWAGAWNQEKYGWGGIRTMLKTAKTNELTPVIQWWYWGDDLSPTCVQSGCTDKYYGVVKNKATWDRLSAELAQLVVDEYGANSGTIIIVETEFNKGSMEQNETFDAWLEEKLEFFRSKGFRVVVGFGNWSRQHWKNYDRAIAAADMIGAQILYSSVRNETAYLSGADTLIGAAKYNHATFGKPTFVTDVAFSSFPTPSYEQYQDTVVREIFARMGELRDAGVQGLIWRMLMDDPKFNTANYHGMAERHWGLLRADGTPKPAFEPFRVGMLTENRDADPDATLTASAR